MTDLKQLTVLLQRIGEGLNPVTLIASVTRAVAELATPPPGDADRLDALAAAYRTAAAATPVATALSAAADALTELAGAVREHQARHARLHQALREALHDATHVGSLPMPDPSALDDLARAAGGLVRGGVEVYTASLAAADRAAGRFADITGGVRVGAAVGAGLPAALAALGVTGYDSGVLLNSQLTSAGARRAALDAGERERFDALLSAAAGDEERAWLYKALAAGHPVDALAEFARAIHGRDHDWLAEHLTLIDRGSEAVQQRFGVGVDQYDDFTCGTTSLIVARAEADPLYALALTSGDPATFDARLTEEQRRVHEQTNVLWPQKLGTSPGAVAAWLTAHGAQPGVRYIWRLADDTSARDISAACREIVQAVDAGHPVPILVGGAVPRHYVLVVGHSAGDVLIFEPSEGRTVRVAEQDFLAGTLAGTAGFDHLHALVVPAPVAT